MFNPSDSSYTMAIVALMDLFILIKDYKAGSSTSLTKAVTEQQHQVVRFGHCGVNI